MIDDDSFSVNPTSSDPVCTRMAQHLNRRQALKLGAVSVSSLGLMNNATAQSPEKTATFLPFQEASITQGADIKLADGFKYKTLLAFGDPLKPDMAPYDPKKLTGEEQQNRFGGRCDFLHLFEDHNDKNRAILCINNEFPEFGEHPHLEERHKAAYYSVGCSVAALKKDHQNNWQVDLESPLNKKITPATPAILTGAAAGNKRLKSTFSTDGIKSAGTIGNCAGGFTPWGTYLTAEENIQQYFHGDISQHPEKKNMRRFGMNGKSKDNFFHKIDKRFDLNSDEQSPLHFGWIVEIDPSNPSAPIRKHTALGRAKHECATMIIDKDGHAVVYTSDDQTFEYLYKFVSKEKYRDGDREQNLKLLESGILYTAQFKENGSLHWLPLVHGQGPLTTENGFHSQGDILLDTRSAADALEATPMDRPEDIAINPKTGKVYFLMTGNRGRKTGMTNAANKVIQGSGHIIEISPEHHASTANWNFLVICGPHFADKEENTFHSETSPKGRFVYPDNGSFDPHGEFWICSDGYGFPGFSDGLWHCDIDDKKGLSRRFATAPLKSEFTGPCFTQDNQELFLSVQHPGTLSEGSFPDFQKGVKARSAVVVIQRE